MKRLLPTAARPQADHHLGHDRRGEVRQGLPQRPGDRGHRAYLPGRAPLPAAGRRRGEDKDDLDQAVGAVEELRRENRPATSSSSCPRSGTSTRPAACSRAEVAAGQGPAVLLAGSRRGSSGCSTRDRADRHRHERRRVVADRSRIRYVIDPGMARISRYSPGTHQQPADRGDLAGVGRSAQGPLRADRAGHLRAAVQRSRTIWPATPTPCRRSSAPIWRPSFCRRRPCGWARSERFPFLDPPKPEAVRDGYRYARRTRRN